jgi:hypothetical protein
MEENIIFEEKCVSFAIPKFDTYLAPIIILGTSIEVQFRCT